MPGRPRLDLDACSDHEMLLIVEAFQGGRPSPPRHGDVVDGPKRRLQRRRMCGYEAGDCVEPVTPELSDRLSDSCVGRSRCSVIVDVGWMRSCSSFADYSQVIYQCIPSECILIVVLPMTLYSNEQYLRCLLSPPPGELFHRDIVSAFMTVCV